MIVYLNFQSLEFLLEPIKGACLRGRLCRNVITGHFRHSAKNKRSPAKREPCLIMQSPLMLCWLQNITKKPSKQNKNLVEKNDALYVLRYTPWLGWPRKVRARRKIVVRDSKKNIAIKACFFTMPSTLITNVVLVLRIELIDDLLIIVH